MLDWLFPYLMQVFSEMSILFAEILAANPVVGLIVIVLVIILGISIFSAFGSSIMFGIKVLLVIFIIIIVLTIVFIIFPNQIYTFWSSLWNFIWGSVGLI